MKNNALKVLKNFLIILIFGLLCVGKITLAEDFSDNQSSGGGEFDLISDEDFLKKTPDEIAQIYQIKAEDFKEAVLEICRKESVDFDCVDFNESGCTTFEEIEKKCPLEITKFKDLTFEIGSATDYQEKLADTPMSVAVEKSEIDDGKNGAGLLFGVFSGFLLVAIAGVIGGWIVGKKRISRD